MRLAAELVERWRLRYKAGALLAAMPGCLATEVDRCLISPALLESISQQLK
jgi:hypothetical protein